MGRSLRSAWWEVRSAKVHAESIWGVAPGQVCTPARPARAPRAKSVRRAAAGSLVVVLPSGRCAA